jgi:hypothetical protein
MMATKRKYTYWHRVIMVDRRKSCSFKVGDVVGLERITHEFSGHDAKSTGFYTMVLFEFLGKLPRDLHETDPSEASRRINAGEWS